MNSLLSHFVAGRWQAGSGAGTPLFDPVLGDERVRVDAGGSDLGAAFAIAREQLASVREGLLALKAQTSLAARRAGSRRRAVGLDRRRGCLSPDGHATSESTRRTR